MAQQNITLVTGGSRGIGKATALLLAERGHKVCINYRQREEEALAVVKTIRQQGGSAIAIAADISDERQILAMFSQIDQRLGPITGLVNNAARLLPQSRVEQLSAPRLSEIFQANISGSILCAREAVKRMSTQYHGRGGAIVNVSSAAARLGSAFEYTDYAASKGAIDTFTRGLSVEVAAVGIRVNAVRPGFIYTDMHAEGGEADRVERVKSQLPMARGGQPIEVAYAIAWLLSEEASYVTGSFIDLAGGKMTSTASVCCTIGSSNLPIIDVEHDGVLASEFIFYWKGVSAGLSDRPALLQLAKRIIAQRLESL